MDKKESISKIKHVSLQNSRKAQTSAPIIKDESIENASSDLDSSATNQIEQTSEKSSILGGSFFEQTINFKSKKKTDILDSFQEEKKASENVSFETVDIDQDPDSTISNAFYSSQKFTQEVSRVFKKTLFALLLDLAVFTCFVFASINVFYFNTPPFISFSVSVLLLAATVAATSFYYILLSDKRFLYSNIILKCIIFITLQSFIGQLFSPITLVSAAVLFLFNYLAYLELEKMQLGSRLFNLNIIAGECRRILITLSIFIFTISTFNQIMFQGSDDNGSFVNARNFIETTVLANDTIVDTVFTGANNSLPTPALNSYFINRGLSVSNGFVTNTRSQSDFTFKSFLLLTYDEPVVISEDELEVFELECKNDGIEDCNAYILDITNTRLEAFRDETFPNQSDIALSESVSAELYRDLTRQYYVNAIEDSARDVNAKSTPLNFLSNIPFTNLFSAKYLLPISLAIILFIVLSILRFVFNWLSSAALFILWHFMALVRFVKVDIENVESEVVSI